MPPIISHRSEQARGAFDGGKILENKPVGFPHEKGKIKGYSNLLYWAHAYSEGGGVIAEHPHQGFDILSFVLSGELVHYDSYHKEDAPLDAGGVQVIRSGSGITHAETFRPGTHIFQIWFDPDLRTTIHQEASYSNYPADQFPPSEKDGVTTITYIGEGSPLEINATGIEAHRHRFPNGQHELSFGNDRIAGIYILSGSITTSEGAMEQDDFLKTEESSLSFEAPGDAELFVLTNPKDPGFTTFLEQNGA